jgi:hypothetical protein
MAATVTTAAVTTAAAMVRAMAPAAPTTELLGLQQSSSL